MTQECKYQSGMWTGHLCDVLRHELNASTECIIMLLSVDHGEEDWNVYINADDGHFNSSSDVGLYNSLFSKISTFRRKQ